MANTLTQVGIETGDAVEAYHVTQSIDAFTGTVAYDISLSGSFNMTGSINGKPSVINPLTASYAMNALSSSYAITASHAITASGIPGTARYLPYWSGAFPAQSNTLSNSSIFQDSTGNILIGGTGAVTSKLYVSSTVAGYGGIQIVSSAGTSNSLTITHLGTNSKFIALTNSASSEIFSISTLGTALLTGSLSVSGSVNVTNLLTLSSQNPLPSVNNGSIAFSSSGDFYFGSGSVWNKLSL